MTTAVDNNEIKERLEKFPSRAKSPTHAVFGDAPDGTTFAYELAKGPHWLMSGTTGSGKSVFVNAVLVSMMVHNTPESLQVIWVDPKKVEAAPYVGLPFCPVNPVTEMSNAYALFVWAVGEMERRYTIMEEHKFKQVSEMNEWILAHPDEANDKGLEYLPQIILVIDEYADLQQQVPETESLIARLGAKARAASITVIVVTQRPSMDVISSTLKSNLLGRVALRSADANNSNIILDEPGAEKLRKGGDAYVKTPEGMHRVQGPFLDDDTLATVFKYFRESFESAEPIDYKTFAVESGECEWEQDYDDDVPMEKRNVKKARRRRF